MKTGTSASKQHTRLALQNARLAKQLAGNTVHALILRRLRLLTIELGLSLERGDLQLLDSSWYVTHSGLLRIAQENRCSGVGVELQKNLSNPAKNHWVFKAIVYKTRHSQGFVGYGDADPSNVPSWLHGCELRIAETRAVNRALRKAYGIGLCSVEELGWINRFEGSNGERNNGSNGQHDQPRLRDRLSQLIRQHHLDASLVKSYAAEFCGTQQLRDASRELVVDFIDHLSDWAARDHDGLVCHLNRHSRTSSATEEVPA